MRFRSLSSETASRVPSSNSKMLLMSSAFWSATDCGSESLKRRPVRGSLFSIHNRTASTETANASPQNSTIIFLLAVWSGMFGKAARILGHTVSRYASSRAAWSASSLFLISSCSAMLFPPAQNFVYSRSESQPVFAQEPLCVLFAFGDIRFSLDVLHVLRNGRQRLLNWDGGRCRRS